MNIERIWAWVEIDAAGDEGTIAAMIPVMGTIAPLVTRSEHVARIAYGPLARAHAQTSGHVVRLITFLREVVHEEVPGGGARWN